MIDAIGELLSRIGGKADAANATGTLMARFAELLTNRITAARAAFLDAAISSRMTSAQQNISAAQAANLDAAISTRLSSAVKTVQYGTVTVGAASPSGTTTITAVTIGKSVLIMLGWTQDTASSPVAKDFPRITLTNSTTVTANTGGAVAGGSVITSFVCVEFW